MNLRSSFLKFLSGLTGLVLTGCFSSANSPVWRMADLKPGSSRMVFVCPTGGVEASVRVNNHEGALYPGGSVMFEVSPGTHHVTVQIPQPHFSPGEILSTVTVGEGDVRYFTLNPTRLMKPVGPSSGLLPHPSDFSGDIRSLELVPVSQEKAAKIAIY